MRANLRNKVMDSVRPTNKLAKEGKSAGKARGAKALLSAETQLWVKKTMERAIDFVPDDEFALARNRELLDADRMDALKRELQTPDDGPTDRLLTRAEEGFLFRRMNYLKSKAAALKARLAPKAPAVEKLTKIDTWMRLAMDSRNQIVRANLRLAISIAKTYVGNDVAFDEILSEAHFSLMQAVEKFDVGKGNKFSTYATRAIRNNLNHYVNRKRRRAKICFSTDETNLAAKPDESWQTPFLESKLENCRKAVSSLVRLLDPEKFAIVAARFGFVGDSKGESLKSIGDRMGVSRERVRQIEARALDDLRRYAAAIRLELPELGT